jgi:hypothetical protein
MGRKKMQIMTDLMESCGTLDVTPGGLLYTLIETLAIKLSDTESAIESMIAGLDPVTCTPETLVSLAANIGMYPFAKLSPIISVPVSDTIEFEVGETVYICEDNSISATVIDINSEKIYLELSVAGQAIQNRLMDLIDDNKIEIISYGRPIRTYTPKSVSLERAGREAETHEAFRARYLSNTRVSPFGGNLTYVLELINQYDSDLVRTYSKPCLSTDKMICANVYIARPDVNGINKPEPLKSSEYAFLESKVNEDCGIGVSISCKSPLIVPTQEKKLRISVQMAHGQKIPKDTIIRFAQEYCYNNIYNFKCAPLNLHDLSVYILAKTFEFGVISIIITTHDNNGVISPNQDEWCLVHMDNVEFIYFMQGE